MRLLLILCLASCWYETNSAFDAGIAPDAPPDGPVSCAKHDDCASVTCLPTGTCALTNDVAYVANLGRGTACTQTEPCATITDAVKLGRAAVKVTGSIAENLYLSGGTHLVLGDSTADLNSEEPGPTIMIRGTAVLDMYGLTLRQTRSGPILRTDGTEADVRFHGTRFLGASFDGIEAFSAKLKLDRVEISGSRMCGIHAAQTAKLTIDRSRIVDNNECGVQLDSTVSFRLTNNVIAWNGDETTGQGGGGLAILVDGSAIQRVASHNTIAHNTAGVGSGRAGGLHCLATVPTLIGSGNVIAYNRLGFEPGNARSNTDPSSTCLVTSSMIATPATDVRFVDASPPAFDYHIRPLSPLIGAAGPSDVTTDIDGDARDGAPDIGADEHR